MDALPAPAYARGFMSACARFLDLDGQALVAEYRRAAEGADRAGPIPPGVLRPVVVRRSRSIRPVAMLFTGLVAAVLGVVTLGLSGTRTMAVI